MLAGFWTGLGRTENASFLGEKKKKILFVSEKPGTVKTAAAKLFC